MATTRLSVYEVDRKLLPDLCMRCGEPATVHKSRKFSWYPAWISTLILVGVLCNAILIVAVILALTMAKRMRVSVPLCDAHKNHWIIRAVMILVGFVGLLGILGVVIAFSDKDFVGILVGALLVGFLGWLILIGVCQGTAIRPTEITDREITLKGVSDTFAEAVLADRRQRGGEEDEFGDRPSRRRLAADDYDRPERGRREPDERISDRDSPRGREPRRARDEDED
jgi:hypothetical protein